MSPYLLKSALMTRNTMSMRFSCQFFHHKFWYFISLNWFCFLTSKMTAVVFFCLFQASAVESVCSAEEGQASAVESLRSDSSWEALEENAMLTDCPATLWVPDHAVSQCTGCRTEFWVGKRKHHCRYAYQKKNNINYKMR